MAKRIRVRSTVSGSRNNRVIITTVNGRTVRTTRITRR